MPHCAFYTDWACLLTREVLKVNSLISPNPLNSYSPSKKHGVAYRIDKGNLGQLLGKNSISISVKSPSLGNKRILFLSELTVLKSDSRKMFSYNFWTYIGTPHDLFCSCPIMYNVAIVYKTSIIP